MMTKKWYVRLPEAFLNLDRFIYRNLAAGYRLS
jgi:hypothetical protein